MQDKLHELRAYHQAYDDALPPLVNRLDHNINKDRYRLSGDGRKLSATHQSAIRTLIDKCGEPKGWYIPLVGNFPRIPSFRILTVFVDVAQLVHEFECAMLLGMVPYTKVAVIAKPDDYRPNNTKTLHIFTGEFCNDIHPNDTYVTLNEGFYVYRSPKS